MYRTVRTGNENELEWSNGTVRDPPSPANLVAGQKVRVEFSGRWYDTFVVTPWIKQPRGKRSIVDYFVFVRLTLRTSHELF